MLERSKEDSKTEKFIAFGGEDARGLWRGCYLTVVVEVDPIVLWAEG